MKRTAVYMGVLLLALTVLAPSCGKKQNITLSKESLTYTYSGGNEMFRIEADCDWEIVGMPDWITVSPANGSGNGVVAVKVDRNTSSQDRNALLNVVSSNGRTKKGLWVFQIKADINTILYKVWFTVTDERWDTDYLDRIIPESYRSYRYYSNPGYENWFFYFYDDHNGVQIYTNNGDTIYYPYTFTFYPDVDSLDICFEVIADSTLIADSTVMEDYHTIVHQIDNEFFSFSHDYRPHQFEMVTTANVTGNQKDVIKINPKKVQAKPKGPLIPVK